ncbi:hypothetical protein [Desulfosudis oleivorans]|nr:hypothetical protein [Desulfosudis oleivorans]
MFFIGTHIDPSTQTAVFAVIRKTLKNVRNHYQVVDVWQAPAGHAPRILAAMYRRPDLVVKKRVFSQDRRPKKDVSAHPKIVVCGSDGACAVETELRSKGLPVESVLLCRGDAVSCDGATRAGAGADYHVPETLLWKTLSAVAQETRLGMEAAGAVSNPQMQALAPILAGGENPCANLNEDSRCLLLAIAGAVWFRETIRYTQAYRTSATSKRRFI